jgi:hypothetical protein
MAVPGDSDPPAWGRADVMRMLIVVFGIVAVVVVLGWLVWARPRRGRQPEPIDALHDPAPPDPEATRHMADPPPGSRGDRERRGMP